MIKIEIPKRSLSTPVSEIHKVNLDTGFYFMRDSSGEIVYIGESLNLRKRLAKHIAGKSSTTKRFYHVFHSVDVFYCDRKDRKIYELYAINLYNPIGNVDGNESATKEELKKKKEDWIRRL
ncbi:GIY-YIG nuclease family protein [Bacillus pacificus]|uniref:GIY-YIG nuclease family protein n=1 Tax=Bacillus pacificus TaxID=2026187 RepID=UPI001E2EA6B5|nr:GIY-YIG nuclease family protein [Bacillus pacificus]UEP95948.1 GIY-YIG nuclease family protein [Bacillus pacificus]HDR7897147.1 GIY-YIG nuclease family protein [Bacillus pacificus]